MARLNAHFPGRAPIDAYGNGGFRFADMSHRGSILCLPSGVHGWEPARREALGLEDLAAVLAESGQIQILLIGMGAGPRPISQPVKLALREAGIVSESMSTGSAVRTYNVLLAEDRAVAAVLLSVD